MTTTTSEWAIREKDWMILEDKPMRPKYLYISKSVNPARKFVNSHKPNLIEVYNNFAEECGHQSGFFLLVHAIDEATEEANVLMNYIPEFQFDFINIDISNWEARERIAQHTRAALTYFEWPTSVPVVAISDTSLYCFLEDFSTNSNKTRGLGK